MKIKTTYISEDGIEFNSETACLEWEEWCSKISVGNQLLNNGNQKEALYHLLGYELLIPVGISIIGFEKNRDIVFKKDNRIGFCSITNLKNL